MNVNYFKGLLKEKALSVRDLSKASGIPEPTLYKYIDPDRDPSLDTVRKLIKALHLTDGETAVLFDFDY